MSLVLLVTNLNSFSSGHVVLSFTMARAIAKQFDNFWAKAGIYVAGSIAPVSRLWTYAHWVSDVGLGMAIGVVVIDDFMRNKAYYYYEKSKMISWNLCTLGLVETF